MGDDPINWSLILIYSPLRRKSQEGHRGGEFAGSAAKISSTI